MPLDTAQEQVLDQLRELARATGRRGPYEAELRRIALARVEAEQALARRRKGGKERGAQVRQSARKRPADEIEAHVFATADRLDPKRENPRGLARRIIEASGWPLGDDTRRRMVARILANRTRS